MYKKIKFNLYDFINIGILMFSTFMLIGIIITYCISLNNTVNIKPIHAHLSNYNSTAATIKIECYEYNVESISDTEVCDDNKGTTEIVSEKLSSNYLDEFMITSYCACEKCCGKSDGITATGTIATEGRTIAVDPNVIPYGTHVLINGNEYIAEDCGGAINGNHIDMFIDSHERALDYGIYYADVYIVN